MRRRSRRGRNRRRTSGGRSEEPRKTGPRRMPNKLFIGNLGRVTKGELEDELRRFGRLQDVWMSRNPAGFAFVEFLNSKDASVCVQALDGRHVLGGKLRVEFAKAETSVPPRRRAKRGERATSRSSRRSRRRSPGEGLRSLMLSSSSTSTRLLPPPKPSSSASMLAPIYDRSPSPLVVVRRGGGLSYEDVPTYRSWDDSARLPRVSSLLLPSVPDRSRSPRPRSPLPLPVVDRDMLSSSGRLLAPPLPPLPSPFASTSYVGSRGQYTPPHIRRYNSRDRSPARYKSRSPLPARSVSRSPVRAPSGNQKRMRTRSASRSPKTLAGNRPRERLLGKTPPLPDHSHSSSPPRYEAPVTKCERERSRSPLAYSSRKIAGAYTPPSPPPNPKVRNSYEKKYSMSPVRKRNSPPPKAYALSSDRGQSPRWSRSRSKSVDRKYSSRSPMHRTDDRSSSSTSPPHYGRSPVAVKREAVSPGNGQMKVLQAQRSDHNPVQRYSHSYVPAKHSRSPERGKSPVYHRVNSPAVHRRSPSPQTNTSRRRASPAATQSKMESYRTASQAGAQWPQASKRSEQNRKRSPVLSPVGLARNGRSPSDRDHAMARSDRVRGAARVETSPVSRDRRSPRRHR